VSLALYRKYRPSTFAEVIGQDHVTGPLQQALRNDRVHHAYLFSGPRGCGKTTSARILARALNCELGPTPEPCGTCQFCQDLAATGPGSMDVIEIDAASHGGVDDARELRERAFFAPAVSRYKIYIVDEAHMVTTAGFNALLKVVEEPPAHLKFIFATTEPDKVIGTIRSRTHHYPFRLVPPGVLRDYLATVCEREGVAVGPGVLPLVVRAGAGSVRDAMSVLDQLIAGAGDDGVSRALATGLLGFTDATLLDDVVDAFAEHDGAAVFEAVDRVIEGGHDPRRFVADLLERLRDLLVLEAVPDAVGKRLIDAPADQIERMVAQASRFGRAELIRAADIVNTGLTELRGATAPRLQLELICARALLPGAHDDELGMLARLDRLERRLAIGGGEPAAPRPAPAVSAAGPVPAPPAAQPPAAQPPPQAEPRAQPTARPPAPEEAPAPPPVPLPSEAAVAPAPASATSNAGALDVAALRRMWPDVLEWVKRRRRYTWMMLHDSVRVAAVGDGVLTLAFAEEGKRRAFATSSSDEVLTQALMDLVGVTLRIDAVLDPGPSGGTSPTTAPEPRPAQPPPAMAEPARTPASARTAPPTTPPPPPSPPYGSPGPSVDPADDIPSVDDPVIDDSGASGAGLVEQVLGGRKIGEFDNS
jgi:DNA polymerase-3 subunit gamma/tau